MLRRLATVAVLVGLSATAGGAERPRILLGAVDDAVADALTRDAAARGLDLVRSRTAPEPSAEEAIGVARPLYRDMAFARALQRLSAAETLLLQDRLPTARLGSALAAVEAWLGALELVDNKRAEAEEHLALARRLDPAVEPDPIFPPEVRALLERPAAAATALPVTTHLLPDGARLWLDGVPVAEPVTTAPGLHWVVVERADRRPFARVVRLGRSAPQISVSLIEPALPEQALHQAAAQAARAPLGADEGLAVAHILGRPLVVVSDGGFTRYDPSDAARPLAVERADGPPGRLVDALCRIDAGCVTIAPPVPPAPPRRPWYRRAAFWIPVAGGAVLVVGAGVLAGTLANASSDYVVRIR